MEQQKKSYYHCSVNGCSNSTLNGEWSFFKLPADPERRIEWLNLIHREDLMESCCLRVRVCEAHFSPDCIVINSRRKLLKKNSMPRFFLPLPNIYAHKETQANIETADASVQCNYDLQTNAFIQTPINDVSNDTPRKRKLLSGVQRCQKRLKIANTTQSEANTFLKLCDKFLTTTLARVIKQQTKFKTQGHGNRGNTDYKMFCLNLYYVNPQAYSFLKDTLCLPSKETLTRMYVPVTTKIHSYLMDVLKTKVRNMSDLDSNCTLVVGATSLKSNLFYNIKEDRVYGFHEVDGVQSPEPAKYALVAMIQGLFENYKQPVGFALLAESKNYPSVTDWIDKLILQLFAIGFNVRSLVSDMGSDFLKGSRKTSPSAERPFFIVGGRKIYHVFDPLHLIKLVRNKMINYEFHFENNVAKWHHILQFYEMDKMNRLRLAPKLTDSHMKPTKSDKRKVKNAAQVFSATVAAGLSTYMDFGKIKKTAQGTIKIIEMMNDLLDFLNSSTCYGRKQYQNAFCGKHYQITFINNMLDLFASLKLIHPNGRNVTSKAKFIAGFQVTLKSLLMLSEDLRNDGFSYILTSRLNQDCLKSFFGQIRTKKGNSSEPTSWQLASAFRKAFFINIFKSPESGNCTEDLTKCLLDGEKLFTSLANVASKSETTSTTASTSKKDSCDKKYKISTTDYSTIDLPEKNALVYVSAYLLRKCFENHKECNELVKVKQEDGAQNYSTDTTFSLYRDGTETLLTLPPDSFIQFVRSMEERYCNFFKSDCLNREILKNLLNVVQTLTFSMPCNCFPLEYCKKLYMRMRIYYTLKYNNRAFRRQKGRNMFSVTNL